MEQVAREGEGERTGAFRLLVGKTEGKRSLGKPRQRGENNIDIHLQEIGRGVDWNVLTQDGGRVGFCECGDEASGSMNWSCISHSLS